MTPFTGRLRTSSRHYLLCAIAAILAARVAAGEVTLLLSSDVEGHVEPCEVCPGDPGSGGLARRASLLAQMRAEPGAASLLLADAGNFLFGAESLESGGKVIVSAYEAMAYDVVNVSWRDFRLGKVETLALLSEARLPCVSANLLDAGSGRHLFKPYVVIGAAPDRVAVIGASEAPAGLDFLPHLRTQLDGVYVRPPLQALEEWLPRAKERSDLAVLLYYGSPTGLRAIRENLGTSFAAVLAGGLRPEDLPPGSGPPVVAATAEHGKRLALVRLRDRATAGEASTTHIAIDASIPPDPEVERLVASFRDPPPTDAGGAGPLARSGPPRSLAPEVAGAAHPPDPGPGRKATAAAPREDWTEGSPGGKAPTEAPGAAVKAPEARHRPLAARASPFPLGVPPAPQAPREPRGIAGVGLTPEQVNNAIEDGAAFLWKHIKENDIDGWNKLGRHPEHSIASLALVHAGAHERFPDFKAELRDYLAAVKPHHLGTYQAGIICMLIESYGDPSFLPALRQAVRYLLEAQGSEGTWSYSTRMADELYRDPQEDEALQVSGGIPIEGEEAAPPDLARATDWKQGQDGDNSVSQYAVLGLQAASRSGVRISAEAWRRCLSTCRARQGEDGNWSYHGKSTTGYGSMTCAGICAVAIARHELGEKEPAKDPTVDAGLAWTAKHFSVSDHPGHKSEWHYYYLYSLERVGRILSIDFVGEHEWYPLGARYLVSNQNEDGSWVGVGQEKDPRLATSFALLFLTRATASLRAQEVRRGGNGVLRTGIKLPKGGRYYFIIDGSGSMAAELGGRTKWEVARDAVRALVRDLPDVADAALRVYGHRKRAIEPGASEDTALEIPLRPLDRGAFESKLRSLRPRGKTPLARSLLEAKRDLLSASPERPVTVILLTDGGDDTLPRQDPLRAAEEFGELKGIVLHVVGLDIGREDWSLQLREMATRAGGRYWPVSRAEKLLSELRAAVFGVPEGFVVLDKESKVAVRGKFGDPRTLPEGKYVLRTEFAGEVFQEPFWINTDAATGVVFNAERVVSAGLPAGGSPPSGAVAGRAAENVGETVDAGPDKVPEPTPAPRFCTGCGEGLKPGGRFCVACGKQVRGK